MNKSFKYETPLWGARLICSSYIGVSLLFFFAFYTYENWGGNSALFFKYFLAFLSLIFFLVVLKPSNWKGWTYFSADDKGLYFPSSNISNDSPKELHIPWNNVGEIKTETLYGNIKGISIELKLSHDEINHYFKNNYQVNKLLGFENMRNDFYVIAYANNIFQSMGNVVSTLNQLKLNDNCD